ncbi:hypothetical protein K2X33_16645 [bacterium]|nr:hypothetical protein [bacterium]
MRRALTFVLAFGSSWALSVAPGTCVSDIVNKAELGEHLMAVWKPDQQASTELSELLRWQQTRAQWPVVLKPATALPEEKPLFCTDDSDFTKAFRRFQEASLNGPRTLVAQEVLGAVPGRPGLHGLVLSGVRTTRGVFLSGVWATAHLPPEQGGAPSVYRLLDLLNGNESVFAQIENSYVGPTERLSRYLSQGDTLDSVENMLDSVGYAEGPFRIHALLGEFQIKVTQIEKGIAQDAMAKLESLATQRTTEEMWEAAKTKDGIPGSGIYTRHQPAAIVHLHRQHEGAQSQQTLASVLEQFRHTIVDYVFFYAEGEPLPAPSLSSLPNLRVQLVGKSDFETQSQIGMLLEWGRDGLFEN